MGRLAARVQAICFGSREMALWIAQAPKHEGERPLYSPALPPTRARARSLHTQKPRASVRAVLSCQFARWTLRGRFKTFVLNWQSWSKPSPRYRSCMEVLSPACFWGRVASAEGGNPWAQRSDGKSPRA